MLHCRPGHKPSHEISGTLLEHSGSKMCEMDVQMKFRTTRTRPRVGCPAKMSSQPVVRENGL